MGETDTITNGREHDMTDTKPEPQFPMAQDDQERLVRIEEGVKRIEQLFKERHDGLNRRVGKLESNQTWLIRLIIGLVVMALLGYFIFDK